MIGPGTRGAELCCCIFYWLTDFLHRNALRALFLLVTLRFSYTNR